MMTVKEVSRRTGVTVRALQYYDRIGLFKPANRTEAGYRLYDDADLGRLSEILLFRELEFPLKEIQRILDSPAYDREKALIQQIELLELRKERLGNLILFARNMQSSGGKEMQFEAFDKQKIESYKEQAKAAWGNTEQYREFSEKDANRTEAERDALSAGMMDIFREFGKIRDQSPASKDAQKLARDLQAYISEHFYQCSDTVLRGLGRLYGAGGEFTERIDAAAGEGTAAFASAAIEACCK